MIEKLNAHVLCAVAWFLIWSAQACLRFDKAATRSRIPKLNRSHLKDKDVKPDSIFTDCCETISDIPDREIAPV